MNWGHPGGGTELVGDHGEKLIVILVVVLEELLRKGLGLRLRHLKGRKKRFVGSG